MPTLKAFVLCDGARNSPANKEQKDLKGAGRSEFQCDGPFPLKLSFWVFIQFTDQKKRGQVQLSLMRADSGRRYFFRTITVRFNSALRPAILCVRAHDCVFPIPGVYFVELWYDKEWIADQRLEIT